MTRVTNPNAPRIAIVGATGAVGATLIRLIEERAFAYRELQLVASARSAGRTLTVDGHPYVVRDLEGFDFGTVDVVFFSAGTTTSEKWVSTAVAAGALVIDNTNAYRMDPDTPLVVPQVNADLLAHRPVSGVIANPNCSTIPLARVLAPMHRHWGLRRVVVSTYQAASGRGHTGVDELRAGSRRTLDHPASAPLAERFTPGLAFNVVPVIDQYREDGFTLEEQKMLQESRKILGLPHLDLTATCVRVPVVNAHSETVLVQCAEPVDVDRLAGILAAQSEVTVYPDGYSVPVPTPRTADGTDHVHVGRIRRVPHDPHAVWMWLVADNLRVGAALNAIQIAERLAGGVSR